MSNIAAGAQLLNIFAAYAKVPNDGSIESEKVKHEMAQNVSRLIAEIAAEGSPSPEETAAKVAEVNRRRAAMGAS